MSKILSEARQLCEDLEPYPEEIGEDGSKAVLDLNRERWEEKYSGRAWAAFDMLPELLAYAEKRETQAIDEKVKSDYPGYDALPEEDRDEKRYMGKDDDFYILHHRGKQSLRAEAAKELDADLSSWHKITEEEKEAIENTIAVLTDYEVNCEVQIGDVAPLIEVLGGLLCV